jgi:ribosome-associated toxin RatA of RatAB toxin-antitoxin module
MDVSSMEKIVEKSDIIMFEKTGLDVPRLSASIIQIDSPPAAIFSVISDYEKYIEFMPTTSKSKIISKVDNVTDYDYQLAIDLIIFSYHVDYTLRATHFPPYKVDETLVKGDLDKVDIFWRLVPVENGEKTITEYFMDVNYRSLSTIVKWALKRQPQLEVVFTGAVPIITSKALKDRINQSRPH